MRKRLLESKISQKLISLMLQFANQFVEFGILVTTPVTAVLLEFNLTQAPKIAGWHKTLESFSEHFWKLHGQLQVTTLRIQFLKFRPMLG